MSNVIACHQVQLWKLLSETMLLNHGASSLVSRSWLALMEKMYCSVSRNSQWQSLQANQLAKCLQTDYSMLVSSLFQPSWLTSVCTKIIQHSISQINSLERGIDKVLQLPRNVVILQLQFTQFYQLTSQLVNSSLLTLASRLASSFHYSNVANRSHSHLKRFFAGQSGCAVAAKALEVVAKKKSQCRTDASPGCSFRSFPLHVALRGRFTHAHNVNIFDAFFYTLHDVGWLGPAKPIHKTSISCQAGFNLHLSGILAVDVTFWRRLISQFCTCLVEWQCEWYEHSPGNLSTNHVS